jgi:hypothetical protein
MSFHSHPFRSDNDQKRLSIALPAPVHKELKMFAIRNEISITDLIRGLVEDLVAESRPNL